MRHPMRRLLIAVLFSIGSIGLLTLVPNVLGLSSATVNVNNGGTYYMAAANVPSPTSRFINCGAIPNTATINWTIQRNKDFGTTTQGVFECTNNWNSDVRITITVQNDPAGVYVAGTFTTLQRDIPAGQTLCLAPPAPATRSFRTNTGNRSGTVTYMVQASNQALAGPQDLDAVFYFSHSVTLTNSALSPTFCTP